MPQHDMVLENAKGADFRADLNYALAALVSTNSGTSAPTATHANMLWYDKTNHTLKMRSEADDAWIALYDVDQSNARLDFTSLFKNNIEVPNASDLYGHINGLTIFNASPDSAHDIAINPGTTIDVNNNSLMTLSSILVKRIDANWNLGHGSGGLDTGTVAADKAYAVWLIRRSDTGVVDALFSTSFTSSGVTLPTNYDELQLLGAISTDGSSNIYTFIQQGDYFEVEKHPEVLVDATITNNTYETATINEAPPNTTLHLTANINNQWSRSAALYLRPKGSAKTAGTYNQHGVNYGEIYTYGNTWAGQLMIALDGSRRFEYAGAEASGTTAIRFYLVGYTLPQRGHAS